MHRLIFCALLLTFPLVAADWPAFRADPQRSGNAPEAIDLPLTLSWSFHPVQAPSPAWPAPMATNYAVMHGPLRQTLTFDRAFHVVSDKRAVYFGSSADDAVYCLDAATGALRWRFVTEGPVRLPPMLSGGKVKGSAKSGNFQMRHLFIRGMFGFQVTVATVRIAVFCLI